jgi:hypothetical protein
MLSQLCNFPPASLGPKPLSKTLSVLGNLEELVDQLDEGIDSICKCPLRRSAIRNEVPDLSRGF